MRPFSYVQAVRDFPPILCRLLASNTVRTGRRNPATGEQIAARAGLSVFEVAELSRHTTWNDVNWGVMLRFQKGCGTIFDDAKAINRHRLYLRRQIASRSPFPSLRASPLWLSYYEPLLRRYTKWVEAGQ